MKTIARSLAVLIGVVIVISSCSRKEGAKGVELTSSDKERIESLNTELWRKAYQNKDTVLLDQILHEQFQLVDDQGETYSKKHEISYAAKYGASYDSFDFDIKKLTNLKNGTVIVFGVGTITGSDIQGPYVSTYKATNVLIHEEGRWQLVSSHVSGVKETEVNQ